MESDSSYTEKPLDAITYVEVRLMDGYRQTNINLP
jgi:hypothetical protein